MDPEKDSANFPLACTAHGCSAKAQVRQKKKKKTSAVKYFLCFQRDDVAFPRVVPVGSSSMVTAESELDVGKCSHEQKKPEQHGFFHALKAVLFKMLLVKKIQQRRSGKRFANIPKMESSITSGHPQEWSDREDVPKIITKTTSSGGKYPVFTTYVKEKEEIVFPTMLKNEETCQDQWINKGRHRLSHLLKAVLYETALARKIQARKLGKRYGSNLSSLRSSTGESCEEDPAKLTKSPASSLTNSSMSSIFTSSSLASTTSSSAVSRSTSHSRSLSERIKSFRSISSSNLKANLRNLSDKIRSNSSGSKSISRTKISLESINSNCLKEEQHAHFADDVTQTEKKNKKGSGCYRSASALCFLLMSLLGLIVYGKLWAILSTSLWLVCVPLFSLGDHKSSTSNVVIEKKEVTTGGGMLSGAARARTRICQSQ